MHRATPANTSFRAFVAGGSRATVDKMDDSKLMQEMSGDMQHNESRSGMEAPQNYGFTSANFGADRDEQGNTTGSAECFISYQGGNRSFPACGPVDDRRHRLKGLPEGDSAMHRGKDDDTQIHLASDGLYHSAPEGRTVRMQLVPPGSGKASPPQDQQQQKPQATAQAANGGSGSSSSNTGQQSQGGNKPTGQKAVKDAGKDSPYYIHVKKDETAMAGKMVKSLLDDKKTYHHVTDKKDYCGGEAGKDQFSKVLTLAGPAVNVYGRIG